MPRAHLLTRAQDIQTWVTDQNGSPAIARQRTALGEEKAELKLRFGGAGQDQLAGDVSPCSWTAWLAELERQGLALQLDGQGGFALVKRSSLH